MDKTRCKFRCNSVTDYGAQRQVEFSAVYSGTPENDAFHTSTPNGNLEITVDNEATFEFFKPGAEYYLDIIAVNTKGKE